MARYKYSPDHTGRDCSRCGEWKTWGNFSVNRTQKSGRSPVCRDCSAKKYQERDHFCVVYSMESGGMLKIGVSTSSEEKTLQRYRTGSPVPVRAILWTHCADEDEAYGLEKELKVILKHRHSHGEWYHLYEVCMNETITFHTKAQRRKFG